MTDRRAVTAEDIVPVATEMDVIQAVLNAALTPGGLATDPSYTHLTNDTVDLRLTKQQIALLLTCIEMAVMA